MKVLHMECFTYVALSRVGSPNCLKLLVAMGRSRNVVYNEGFN